MYFVQCFASRRIAQQFFFFSNCSSGNFFRNLKNSDGFFSSSTCTLRRYRNPKKPDGLFSTANFTSFNCPNSKNSDEFFSSSNLVRRFFGKKRFK
jgi:hypothetical protein